MRSLVLVAWMLPICALAQNVPADVSDADRPSATSLAAQIDGGDALTEDVTLQLRFRQNERGLVRIHTFDDGPTLFASVVRGQAVDYLGLGADGRVLMLTEAETEFGGERSCWRCATEGGAACWQVLCRATADS
ncbi:MAG: hypothetical protein AAF845_11550 [Bacteroidota bacterium]